ncbi:MAG TPA: YicC/YloC family endoribonuclease [Candidatus Acidoferrum sp.]|nr:YicC/YloC family endoribonuclease [Candidatus Acidoferrum sp.]
MSVKTEPNVKLATPAKGTGECRSMTGYAMVRGEHGGWSIRVSVKSVNHRFLEVKLRMPDSLEPYELRLRQAVREKVHRGHLDVHVNVEPGESAPVHVHRELLEAYLNAARALQKQTHAKTELDLVALLRLPGVVGGLGPSLPETEEEQGALGKELERYLREALDKMDEMRLAEGRQLAEEMRARLNRISEQAEKARGLVDTLQPMFTRRLESRLRELLSGVNVDAGRIAQEAALLAERSDISEELDRLRSHLLQFRRLVDGAGEVGKKLDFLLQEMHREANTILSKTPGVESEALAVMGLSLEIKAEIEKLREQVQNLE